MDRSVLQDKIFGCWLGKNIGGTLGAPLEGQKNPKPLPLEFPEVNVPNDDLDLQLVWLDLLREKGLRITADDLMYAWKKIGYSFDEYGIAKANIERGLRPPLTGSFNNYFSECMGCPIRSEIWAVVAAGMPDTAAYYAMIDGIVDHAGESVYSEIFFAVLESMAFEESDILALIRKALAYVPESSEMRQAVEETVAAWQAHVPLAELRETLVKKYDRGNFTHCVLNIAFTIAGVLYSEGDFLKSIIYSVNLGYDTDCTGATAGAIIGILDGGDAVIRKYDLKFDNRILIGAIDAAAPKTLEELTDWSMTLHEQLRGMKNPPVLPKNYRVPEMAYGQLELHRTFKVGVFGSIEEAKKSGDWQTVHTKNDMLDLSPFVTSGRKIYVSAVVRNPAGNKVCVCPHSNGLMNVWFGDTFIAQHKQGDFAPSSNRLHSLFPNGWMVIPENGLRVLCEIEGGDVSPLLFSIVFVRPGRYEHEINAVISPE